MDRLFFLKTLAFCSFLFKLSNFFLIFWFNDQILSSDQKNFLQSKCNILYRFVISSKKNIWHNFYWGIEGGDRIMSKNFEASLEGKTLKIFLEMDLKYLNDNNANCNFYVVLMRALTIVFRISLCLDPTNYFLEETPISLQF